MCNCNCATDPGLAPMQIGARLQHHKAALEGTIRDCERSLARYVEQMESEGLDSETRDHIRVSMIAEEMIADVVGGLLEDFCDSFCGVLA